MISKKLRNWVKLVIFSLPQQLCMCKKGDSMTICGLVGTSQLQMFHKIVCSKIFDQSIVLQNEDWKHGTILTMNDITVSCCLLIWCKIHIARFFISCKIWYQFSNQMSRGIYFLEAWYRHIFHKVGLLKYLITIRWKKNTCLNLFNLSLTTSAVHGLYVTELWILVSFIVIFSFVWSPLINFLGKIWVTKGTKIN